MNKHLRTACVVLATGFMIMQACKSKKQASNPPAESKPIAVSPVQVVPAESSKCDQSITFESHVKKIIDDNCANSCHSAIKHASGIDLSNKDNVKDFASKSNFLGSIKHEAYYSPMPKNHAKMADSSILVLECWIENGMK
ncbi:MAG TPA: hypothetical protein VGF79_04910 [Bacteroidia bacterium]